MMMMNFPMRHVDRRVISRWIVEKIERQNVILTQAILLMIFQSFRNLKGNTQPYI